MRGRMASSRPGGTAWQPPLFVSMHANRPQVNKLPHSGNPQTITIGAGRLSGGRGRPIDNRPQVANLSHGPAGHQR